MNIKKFIASTSREALRKLREAMGPDAVIISNRTVNGQVEILALVEDDLAGLHKEEEQFAMADGGDDAAEFNRSTPSSKPVSEASSPYYSSNVNSILESQQKFASKKMHMESPYEEPIPMQEPVAKSAPVMSSFIGAEELMSELRSMRGMMEAQYAEMTWGNSQKREPHRAKLMKEMLTTGFSAGLARHLIENMPKSDSPDRGLSWIKAVLSNNINTISSDSDMLEEGGVFALVGPTGVGKTTTTAKLAARCVMRHGAGKLALITTDGYRIGGYEQLRIYGKILGVMVHAVKDECDLKIALSELKNKHMVLIDTVGMSQRDRLVSEQVAMLSGANVKKLLCLNATSSGETLAEVIQSYQGAGLSGCVVTKMDEAASIGAVLDAIIRHKLTMYYLANGQRVPEDLHVANKNYLVDHSFRLKRENAAFQFQDDELPILMSATSKSAMNDYHLRGVSLGK